MSRTQTLGISGYLMQEQPSQSEMGRNYVTVQRTPDGQTYETSYTLGNGVINSTKNTWKASDGEVMMSLQTTSDVWGNTLTKTESRTGTTIYTNDESTGTLLKVVTPDGLTTEYEYDDLGRKIATILPDGTKQNVDYDQEGRVTRQWGSQQYPVKYEYDAWGQKTGMITYRAIVENQANWPETTEGDRTTWIYEASTGNLLQKKYADGKGMIYTYTPGRKLKTLTNARGNVSTHSYDGAGQLISTVVNDNLTPAQNYAYDQWGRQISVSTEGVASYQYAYNDQSQVVQEDIALSGENGVLNRQITRSYDQYGRIAGYQLKQGEAVEQSLVYQYNAGSQLSGIVADGKEFHYDYVPTAPHLIGKVTSPVHVVTNSYEPQRDQLSNKSNSWKNKTDNSVISGYTYVVNNVEQRASVVTSGEAFSAAPADWQWQYDTLGQVISANQNTYVYDQIGNRKTSRIGEETETSYTANALNQYTTVNTTIPSYDEDGNLLSGLSATPTLPERNQLVFIYNANNRPIRVEQNNEIKEHYAYDHQGRRVKKGNTFIVYDGYNAVAQYGNTTLQSTFSWGIDMGGNLQQLAGGAGGLIGVTDYKTQIPVVSYPAYDGNGNISEYLTEENHGTISAHFEYDPFGNVTKKTGMNEYEYQFSTKPYDKETGLNYYNYRGYNPSSGRWINRDPMGEYGGSNLYVILYNTPFNKIDYLGLSTANVTQNEETQSDGSKLVKFNMKGEFSHQKQYSHVYTIMSARGYTIVEKVFYYTEKVPFTAVSSVTCTKEGVIKIKQDSISASNPPEGGGFSMSVGVSGLSIGVGISKEYDYSLKESSYEIIPIQQGEERGNTIVIKFNIKFYESTIDSFFGSFFGFSTNKFETKTENRRYLDGRASVFL